MRRRGSDIGPALTVGLCAVGMKVRLTSASTLFSGMVGTIVDGAGTTSPLVRFDTGMEKALPAHRLQVVVRHLTDEQRKFVEQTQTQTAWPPILPDLAEHFRDRMLESLKVDEGEFRQRTPTCRPDAKWNF